MSIIHHESDECSTSPLEWFQVNPTHTAIENSLDVEYQSSTSLRDGAAVVFTVLESTNEYTDLENTKLYIKFKIVRADGSDLTAADVVAPVNDLFNSMWSNIEVSFNDRLVSHSNNIHGYTSMISHLVHDSDESLKSERSTRLIYKDTPNQHDVTEARLANKDEEIPGYDMEQLEDDADGNKAFRVIPADSVVGNNGLYQRYMQTRNSRSVEMLGRLRINLFEQERYLPTGIKIHIQMHRQKDRYCLMSAEGGNNYRIKLEKAILTVRRVKPSPGVLLGHADAMKRTPAKYPITRKECVTIAVPAGMRVVNEDNIFRGQLPTRVVICMVDGAAYAGAYHLNPYNFKHFNFRLMQLFSDGYPVQSQPLKPTFDEESFIHCYETLYRGLNKINGERSSIIKRHDWPRGYSLVAYDLTPDMDSTDNHYAPIKHGNLRLQIEFADALAATINVLVYAEFENILEITGDKNITYDYV